MGYSIETFASILAVSTCFWALWFLFSSIRTHRFIVKRYEQESDLLDTAFFKEHATFSRCLPNLASAVFYKVHLLMCTWGWKLYKGKKAFKDIQNPNNVTKHFSDQEISRVKRNAIIGLIAVMHAAVYFIGIIIWPEIFK
jgi:hypothetical protein